MEYILWCDESEKSGTKYSNFYGGVLVSSTDKEHIEEALNKKKEELNLFGEIKWTKISATYYKKYIEYINFLWEFVQLGKIKIRIMFTKNSEKPETLSKEQKNNEFYKLYYQFLKHSFGFNTVKFPIDSTLRIMFDSLPETKEKNNNFKEFILSLNYFFSSSNLTIRKDNIAEVDSHKHVLLQSMDIILGAMDFRLNEKHKIIPENAKRRGAKTIAKEKVYNHINKLIRSLYGYPFNIGVTTALKLTGKVRDRWDMPYRHWSFKSYMSEKSPALPNNLPSRNLGLQ